MTTQRPRVAIEKFKPGEIDAAVSHAMDFVQWETWVPKDARVSLKPNFTYPFYQQGITTSPAFIEAVVKVLLKRTPHIRIVESTAAAHSWSADKAFEGHNLLPLVEKYGVSLHNLSNLPRRAVRTEVFGSDIELELPNLLLDETDVLITLPVPKVHAMTNLTLGFKNQWGCIPDVFRLKHHPQFNTKILAVHKLLKVRAAIFDGTFFLNRMGPMEGDVVPMHLVIASDDVGAGSFVAARVMDVDPAWALHQKLAMDLGMMPRRLEDIDCNAAPAGFVKERFYLKKDRNLLLATAAFRSNFLTWFGYLSPMAGVLHELVYKIRGRPPEHIKPQW